MDQATHNKIVSFIWGIAADVLDSDGSVRHHAIDNHLMVKVFEELVRKFNEENNEEAGEHWTPRDAVKLLALLVFLPVARVIRSGAYLLYDGALGTGGMLTVAEETLQTLVAASGVQVTTHLYGQEINPETYAICKADTPDAWIKQDASRIGYESSFTRHFYQPQPLRTIEEIRAELIRDQEHLGERFALQQQDSFRKPSSKARRPRKGGSK